MTAGNSDEVWINNIFGKPGYGVQILDYTKLSGMYPSNSAFALHFAVDRIKTDNEVKRILICNNLNPINLGLTLVESV